MTVLRGRAVQDNDNMADSTKPGFAPGEIELTEALIQFAEDWIRDHQLDDEIAIKAISNLLASFVGASYGLNPRQVVSVLQKAYTNLSSDLDEKKKLLQ
jgi:hypothetical protein